jgi:hypothetical protein
MTDRQEWEQATARSRQLAVAADAELRRRYPDRKIEPLRSAEPAPVSDVERQHPNLIPHQGNGEAAWIRDLKVQQQIFRTVMNEHEKLTPGKNAARGRLGRATPALTTRWPDAILQPPKPEITPSAKISQRAAEHDIEPEAGD